MVGWGCAAEGDVVVDEVVVRRCGWRRVMEERLCVYEAGDYMGDLEGGP